MTRNKSIESLDSGYSSNEDGPISKMVEKSPLTESALSILTNPDIQHTYASVRNEIAALRDRMVQEYGVHISEEELSRLSSSITQDILHSRHTIEQLNVSPYTRDIFSKPVPQQEAVKRIHNFLTPLDQEVYNLMDRMAHQYLGKGARIHDSGINKKIKEQKEALEKYSYHLEPIDNLSKKNVLEEIIPYFGK